MQDGSSPLHAASDIEIANELIMYGANLDATNEVRAISSIKD